MAAPHAGAKRGRGTWEECEDVDTLKQHLSKQDVQLKRLTKDNNELKKALAAAEGKQAEESSEDLDAFVMKLRKIIGQAIESQMVYRRQANKSRVATSLPKLTLPQVMAIVGPDLAKLAKNGPKRFEIKADDKQQLYELFESNSFSKGLRYRGCLSLCVGLKFTYEKAERDLKVSGQYSSK